MSTVSLNPRKYHERSFSPRVSKIFAIVIVFAMGAAFTVPTPVAAQLGGTLSGTILDADGATLEGVDVVLRKQVNGSLWSFYTMTTSADGAYSFNGLQSGSWILEARLDGYRTNQTTVSIPTTGGSVQQDVTIVSLLDRRYTGTVLDAEDNAPIKGAKVTVIGYSSNGEYSERSTTSAEDGTFSIRLFGTENQVRIEKGGYGTYHDWVYQPSGIIERTIHLYSVPAQTAIISGKVVDANGDPIQAYISIQPDWSHCCVAYADSADSRDMAAPEPMIARPYYHYNNHNSTISAEDGSFQMHAYAGEVLVQANRRGHLVTTERVTLQDGQTTQVTFTLVPLPERTVTITGTVTNKQTGAPVEGASVSIQVPAAGDYHWTNTDAEGKFTAKVRPGYTIVEVHYWSWCCYEVAYDMAEPVSDKGSSSSDEGSGEFRSTPAPAPPRDDTRYHPLTVTFTTQANGERDLALGLTTKPAPQTTVVGYVLDAETGQAVAGARVSLQNHDTGEWGQATTDANGSYKFSAYGGYHTARVWVEGYLPAASNVDIRSDGTQRLDLEVHPGDHASEGWWSPDGDRYDDDKWGVRPMPMPMPADGRSESAPTSASGQGGLAFDSAESSSGFMSEGPQSYSGSGGGLPPYDASKRGDTFGLGGETTEAPVHLGLAVMIALAFLVFVGARRRPE